MKEADQPRGPAAAARAEGGTAAGGRAPGAPPHAVSYAVWIVILLAVSTLTLWVNLGGRDLWGADEAGYAQTAREMLASRQWLTPTYLGQQPAFDKPPVFYWLLAGARWLFGPAPAVFCVPSALFGTATVLLTFVMGAVLYGVPVGGVAGFVLATAFLFVYSSRQAVTDIVLLACLTGALFAGHCALAAEMRWRRRAVLASVLLAAGTAIKGAAGLGIPVLVLALAGSGGTTRWRRLAAMAGLALALVTPLYLWFGTAFTGRFLVFDHLRRFLIPQAALGGNHPWYFYGAPLLAGFLPWTPFLPAVIAALTSLPDAIRRWRLPLVWVGVTLLLITLGANKREPYLLPLFPALALLVGAVGGEVLAGRACAAIVFWWRMGIVSLGTTLAVAALVLPVALPARVGILTGGPWQVLVAGLGGWVAYRSRYPAHPKTFGAVALLVLGASQVLVWHIFPAMNQNRSAREAATKVRSAMAEAPVALVGKIEPGLVFYLDVPEPASSVIPSAQIPQALHAGRRVLAVSTALPPTVLSNREIRIRARVRLDHSEYLVLENAVGDPPGEHKKPGGAPG